MDFRWPRWAEIRPVPLWRALLIAAVCVAAGTGLRLLGGAAFGVDLPFVAYFPAVLVASVWGGFAGGAAALAGSTAVAIALFIPSGLPTPARIAALAAFVLAAAPLVLVGGALARSLIALRAREAQARTLAEELAHRAKNGFSVVQAIIAQSARGAGSVAELEQVLMSRLRAMAAAQELVSEKPDESAELPALIATTLAPFDAQRFEVEHDGADVVLHNRNLALGLALILHELATNAVKYGALSAPTGRVALRAAARDGNVEIRWAEQGGPPVRNINAIGFGTRLLQNGLTPYGGRGERELAPDGVVCVLRFPLSTPSGPPLTGAAAA